jgi:hypothetical protein
MRFDLAAPYRLLVRRPGTMKFLRATGRWTKKVESAFSFPNTINAVHTCLSRGLHEVELVFHYGGADEHSVRIECA